MPAIETISLTYKISSLLWEIGKVTWNAIGARGSAVTIASSLTTLEFAFEDGKQIADYVQDRTIIVTKDNTPLPTFFYGTQGEDVVDGLMVDEADHPWTETRNTGEMGMTISPRADLRYSKGSKVRAVLFAHSINGFMGEYESFTFQTPQWVNVATMAVLFPPSHRPESVDFLYQTKKDDSKVWHPMKDRHERRRTTRGRIAASWEASSPTFENKYEVRWKWKVL